MTNPTNSRTQTVLAIDALTCLAAGVLMAFAAAPLAGLTDLPAGLLRWAGIALFPVALLFGAMSRLQRVPQPLLWLAVLGNAAWILASLVVVALVPANPLGYAFVLAQAAVVAVLTALEARALGRAGAAWA